MHRHIQKLPSGKKEFLRASFPTWPSDETPQCSSRRSSTWLYRYNESMVEVLDKLTNAVIASLHVDEMTEDGSMSKPEITCITDGVLEDVEHLALGVWDKVTRTSMIWRFQPFTGWLAAMNVQLDRPIVLMEVTRDGDAKRGHATPYLIVATDRDLCVTPWVGEAEHTTVEEPEEVKFAHVRLPKASSQITAIASHVSATMDLTIMSGTVTGRIDIWRLYTGDELTIEHVTDVRAPKNNVPITHLHFEGPDKSRKLGVLFTAQSEVQQESWRDLTNPWISAINLDAKFAKRGIALEAELLDGDRGQILAMRVLREGHGFRIVAVSNRYDEKSTRTEITIIGLETSPQKVCRFLASDDVLPTAAIEVHTEGTSCDILSPGVIIGCANVLGQLGPARINLMDCILEKFQLRGAASYFRPERLDAVRQWRTRMDNELFIDHLLIESRVHAAYPPQSMKELQNLFSSIEGADISQRQKDCLSLYLIQDLRTADDAAFVRDRFMSERDVHEISGFWAMDHGQFEEAVRLFALSGNSDNIAPRVLKLLIMNGRHKEAVRYIQAVDPVLNRDEDIYLRMALYLKIDLLQAMMFQRSFESTPLGDRLWGQFLQYIFQNNSLPKALLALSLTDAEEARLINYCQTTGSRSCLEFMVTYFVHRGRIAEALEFLQSLGRHVEKRDAVNRVETDLTIVRNFELILPVVQRIAQQVGVSDVDLSRPVPLSASLNIRSSCLTNVDAQSMLIKALRSALALSKTVTVPDSLPAKDDTFEILPQMDDSILDISSVYSEEGQSMVSSELPDTLDEMTDSRPNSPTPSGLGDQSMFSLREESVVSEQEDLPHLSPLMQSAPPPSSYLGRMSASFARPPSPTLPYQTPITHQPQSQQSAYRSPEMMGSLYEEQVQRVKSPVGPSVPQAPPMTSMSPFSPQVKEPARVTRTASRVEKHKRSTRKRSTSPVRKPPTLQSRLTEVANDLNTPTRRSGRIAAKQQATHETDDRSGETGASVTRKRAKVLDDDAHHNVSTTTPAVATHGTTAARSTRTKTAASNAARAAEPPTATRSRRRTHEEQHEPVPALTKSRSILKASEPSSAAKGLRERNTAAATPARLTRTATAVKKAAAAQELDALINDDDGPMRLEDLLQQQQTPAPKRGARKKDQENATEEKPGRKSTRAPTTTTPAAPAPKLARSVVTRRMAKQLEREGQL